ncbi:hypothetical protein EGW08_021296 [Elysia chlorotica]|uniref:Uncharacterized protein n=1 Tax=Elysia chlorotica TaxID=188477 RepID=A0A433SP11_ELYCH|nr:hypothetical protein EGW08_021296 [Elysia chlorotica]
MPPPRTSFAQQQEQHQVHDHPEVSLPLDQNQNYHSSSWRDPEPKIVHGHDREYNQPNLLQQLEQESDRLSGPEDRLAALTRGLQLEQESVSDRVRQDKTMIGRRCRFLYPSSLFSNVVRHRKTSFSIHMTISYTMDMITLPKWREASATPSMASITSTDESFQYHGDLQQQQREHYHLNHSQQQQHQYPADDELRNSPANSSKMSTNLLDSCL